MPAKVNVRVRNPEYKSDGAEGGKEGQPDLVVTQFVEPEELI